MAILLLLACSFAVDKDAGLSCVLVLGRFPVLVLWSFLVVKPGIFSKGHPFPRQRQALGPNRWWG